MSRLRSSWYLDALNIALLFVGALVLYGFETRFIPTGADAGNWLAIASERLGRDVMAAEVTYLPLFPGLLAGLLWVWGPLLAFAIAAILTIGALATAVYVSTRPIGRGYAFAAAIVAGVAGNQVEAYAWGGYPQLLATAFGLLATFMLLRYHDNRSSKYLWAGVALVGATVATHALIGGLLVVTLVTSSAYWAYLAQPAGRVRAVLIGVSCAGAAALVVLIATVWRPEGVVPTLNPENTRHLESLSRAVREATIPWAVVTLGAVAVLFRRAWSPSAAATVATGTSWAVVGLGFFLVTGEPRGLMIVQVGVVISAFATFAAVLSPSGAGVKSSRTGGKAFVARHRLATIAGVSLFFALVVSGLGTSSTSADWYRLVDQAELTSLDRLREVSAPDDLVFASRGRRSMPVGWWTQGYGQRQTYSGHDTAYLAFPDERSQAEIANSFFSGDLSVAAARSILDKAGADFIAVDRRGPDARWLRGDFAKTFSIIDDSSNIVILEVPQEQS